MSKLLNIKSYSLNVKVAISLFILALFLLTILFALIVPKMQKEQYNRTIKEIEQVLSITEEQVRVAGKAIIMQTKHEIELNQKILELELLKVKSSLDTNSNINDIIKLIDKTQIKELSNYAIKISDDLFISDKKEIYNDYKIKNYNQWETHLLKDLTRNYVYYKKFYFYTIKTNTNTQITLFSKKASLNKGHAPFEKDIKINVQKAFNTTQELHKGKTYLMWINSKYKNENNKPLYIKDKILKKEKYSISNMSNVDNIYTGNLSAKQILNARNKEPVSHLLNGKEALTWVRDLSQREDKNYIFLLVKTLYKEDINKQVDSAFFKILPAAITALIVALLIGFFLFKRLFKTINTLTFTAKQINQGNKTIRSNVKGHDDIGILGIAFDTMIDNFENSIKLLDDKVDDKTKELKSSLEEKEILLKEIHHRVKNNLALTISLIKLQQAKIEDKNTKKVLKDIQERIYTMELLHRKLYESTNLNSINLKDYIKNLARDISNTYNYENEVSIEVNMEDIHLDIETAMPCGLILNEIITNAFKYAFKEHKNPKLNITMKKENNSYELTIKDNGKGIDENIDIYTSSSLGLKLINSICKLQLHGELEYVYKQGALFKIRF